MIRPHHCLCGARWPAVVDLDDVNDWQGWVPAVGPNLEPYFRACPACSADVEAEAREQLAQACARALVLTSYGPATLRALGLEAA